MAKDGRGSQIPPGVHPDTAFRYCMSRADPVARESLWLDEKGKDSDDVMGFI